MATLGQRLLEKLEQLAGGSGVPVSNSELRSALGWQQDTYTREKDKLIKAKQVLRAKGQGGSVILPPAASPAPNKPLDVTLSAFISYSHADQAIKDQLVKHLVPLQRLGLINSWNDGEIKAGESWDKEISRNLDKAQIVILLISIDIINSEYCYDKELSRAMERHVKDRAVVVPVIARDCLWKALPFGQLQALPKAGKAIATWEDRDAALADVAEGIRQLVAAIREKAK